MSELFQKTEELYGRKNLLASIEDKVIGKEMPENEALLGLKGVGKSSVLHKVFDTSHQEKYFKEKRVVVIFVDSSRRLDSMENFYSYLYNIILDGLDDLEKIDQDAYSNLMNQVSREKDKVMHRAIKLDESVWESILSKTIETIRNAGYRLILVIDDFERFAFSSKLMAAQYRYLRNVAYNGQLSMFITSCQTLTMVSEQLVGSGFENIFEVKQLRGIRESDVEDWLSEVAPDLQFDETVSEWIKYVTGGIPGLIYDAIHIVCDTTRSGDALDLRKCYQLLYNKEQPLMKSWWEGTSKAERKVFEKLLMAEPSASIEQIYLIEKGYLKEENSGEIGFVSSMFEEYVMDMLTAETVPVKANEQEETKINEMFMMFQNAISEIDSKMTNIMDYVSKIPELLRADLPPIDNFYNEDTGELEDENYSGALSSYIMEKLSENCDEEICETWRIDKELWDGLSDSCKKDAATAYKLYSIGYSEEKEDIDYTPVTVMLGNFLEGILNECFLPVLKEYIPEFVVQVGSRHKELCDMDKMTIGSYAFVLDNSNIKEMLLQNRESANVARINPDGMNSFLMKIQDCNDIRINADHSGQVTNYESMKNFITKLFPYRNSLLNMISRIYNAYL